MPQDHARRQITMLVVLTPGDQPPEGDRKNAKGTFNFLLRKMLQFHPKNSKVRKVDAYTVIYALQPWYAERGGGRREGGGLSNKNKGLRAGFTTPTFLVHVN